MADNSVVFHNQAKSFEFYLSACDKASLYLTKEAFGAFNNPGDGYRITFNAHESLHGVEIFKLPNQQEATLESTVISCHVKRFVRIIIIKIDLSHQNYLQLESDVFNP